jgi:hypothetical protein
MLQSSTKRGHPNLFRPFQLVAVLYVAEMKQFPAGNLLHSFNIANNHINYINFKESNSNNDN